MTVRGILFDKDGTLTDFHATWVPTYQAAARVIEEVIGDATLGGKLMAAGGYDEAYGRCEPSSVLACGSTAEIAAMWAEISHADQSMILDVLGRTFADHAADRAVPAADLNKVFSELEARGLMLGIATMDSEALAHQLLANFGLSHFFSFVCGYDSGFGEKPTPGMVFAFCESSSLQPDEVAVVGDTPHDMNMARSAGVALSVGVLSGASGRESLASLADVIVNDIGSLRLDIAVSRPANRLRITRARTVRSAGRPSAEHRGAHTG